MIKVTCTDLNCPERTGGECQHATCQGSPGRQMYQLGIEDGTKAEQDRLVAQVRKWKRYHHPGENAKFCIQNLLGDYFGWGSDNQDTVSELFRESKVLKGKFADWVSLCKTCWCMTKGKNTCGKCGEAK